MKHTISILCSNLKGNLGDFAIAEAIALAAQRYLGECRIQLYYHANKAVDQTRLQVLLDESDAKFDLIQPAPYFRRPRLLRIFCRLGLSNRAYSKWHNLAVARVAKKYRKCDSFYTAVSQSDLVLFAGGAQWGRGDLNLNMFAQLHAIAGTNCPVRAFPFSLSNATVKCNGAAGLNALFQPLSQPIFVRDGISHSCLQKAAVEAELVSDCVFSLSAYFDSKWDSESSDSGQSAKVFISLTQSGDVDAPSVVALVQSLKSASLEPALFSTCEVEDRPFYEQIQRLTDVKVIYPLSWKQAVKELSCCRFVITNRLHCTIFSALSGTPVVPVTNRSKSKAYVKDADLPCSLDEVGGIDSAQIDLFNESLVTISNRQVAYAKACGEIMEQRLPELFVVNSVSK
ncbi:MAG: polysaccharide pyruvyl transferase family protein [Opitutaceae bacterium]